MDSLGFYRETVLPTLSDDIKQAFFERYPQIRLVAEDGFVPVREQSVLMLSALTGTGKSTTLSALSQMTIDYDETHLPTRRDLANMIIIPIGQVLADDPIVPVTNREARFRYTRLFAQHVEGGMASVYGSLFVAPSVIPFVSEGIRGAQEIEYALRHCLGWHILELTLHPVTRLRRLSSREDVFDQAQGTYDLSFLPEMYHTQVQQLLQSGDISAKALTIMRAESENYGLTPYDGEHDHYTQLAVDTASPQEVASVMATLIHRMNDHAPSR